MKEGKSMLKLYKDDGISEVHTQYQCGESSVLISELEDFMINTRKRKTPESDNIIVEEKNTVCELGIEVIATLLNDNLYQWISTRWSLEICCDSATNETWHHRYLYIFNR